MIGITSVTIWLCPGAEGKSRWCS